MKDRLYYWCDDHIIVTCVAVILAVIIAIGAIIAFADSHACDAKAEIKGYDYEWDFFAGCVYRGGEEKDQTIEVVR